jgi:lipoprotein signal peptidase
MAGDEHVLDLIHIVLVILWIWMFLQNKRKRTLNYIHITLLLFAVGILLNSLVKWS